MDKYSLPHPDRQSYANHLRQVKYQIVLPILLATLVVIGFAVLAGFAAAGSGSGVSLWADISLIWLIIPIMFFALLIFALLVGLVYGLTRLLKITPYYMGIVQSYILWLNDQVLIWSEKIIKPVLFIKTWLDVFIKSEK